MTPSHLREVSADGTIISGDVAAELYAARLRRGVDLRDVSLDLRIHADHLLAIEEGRFSDLPGPAYVIGFLRSYAAYLDLDANDLVRRFKAETTEFDARLDLNSLEPYDEGGVPTGALIALALVLAAGAYGGWYYVANLDNVAIERVPQVPERMIAAVTPEAVVSEPPAPEAVVVEPAAPEPVAEAEPAPVESTTEPAQPVEPAGETTAPEPAVVLSEEPFEAILATAIEQIPAQETAPEPIIEAEPEPLVEAEPEQVVVAEPEAAIDTAPLAEAEPEPEPVIEAAPEPDPVSPEPAVTEPVETAALQPVIPAPVIEASDYLPREFGQANTGSIITLRAREESWVQVTGENNELLLTRILRPGDVYHVPNRAGLTLMTGNAGGIEILVNGEPTPPLGEIGKVRRQVALDPARLRAGTAVDP